MNIRQKNALITKENVYNAAIKLFEKKGFENTTINDITQEAGTAKGTFYVHYKSKNDLVAHTVEVYNEIARKAYSEAEKVKGFEERLLKFAEGLYAGVAEVGREIIKALYRNNIVDSSTQIVNDFDRDIYTGTRKIIEYGISTGELSSDKPVDFYLNRCIITYMGIDYYWCCSTEYMNLIDVSQRQMKALIEGIKVK